MRNTLFVAIFILLQISFLEANAFHFEVIHAENAYLTSSNKEVVGLMKLREDDQVRIKSGYLLLINSMGEFYEVEGDTLLAMRLLTNQIDYKKDDQIHGASRLLKEESFSISYTPTSRCDNGDRDIVFGFIPESKYSEIVEISAGHCLLWQHADRVNEKEQFTVEVKNMFGDLLIEEKSDQNYLQLSLDSYETPKNVFLVQVFTSHKKSGKNGCASEDIGLKVVDKPDQFVPNACGHLNAVRALEIAFHLERFGRLQLAEAYYKKSLTLSDRKIYQLITELFLKRN